MTYRITDNINLPFKIMPLIKEYVNGVIEARIKVKSIFDKNVHATNVVIKIPCPRDTSMVNSHSRTGRAKYEPDNGAVVWRIKKYHGDHETFLRSDMARLKGGEKKPWKMSPILMDFQVAMFTASGLRIRFLKVTEKNAYKPVKWIRYITKAGCYEHRL